MKKMLLLILSAFALQAQEPIVLQNGTGSYDGCEDSYLNSHMFFTKYGEDEIIKLRDEDCTD